MAEPNPDDHEKKHPLAELIKKIRAFVAPLSLALEDVEQSADRGDVPELARRIQTACVLLHAAGNKVDPRWMRVRFRRGRVNWILRQTDSCVAEMNEMNEKRRAEAEHNPGHLSRERAEQRLADYRTEIERIERLLVLGRCLADEVSGLWKLYASFKGNNELRRYVNQTIHKTRGIRWVFKALENRAAINRAHLEIWRITKSKPNLEEDLPCVQMDDKVLSDALAFAETLGKKVRRVRLPSDRKEKLQALIGDSWSRANSWELAAGCSLATFESEKSALESLFGKAEKQADDGISPLPAIGEAVEFCQKANIEFDSLRTACIFHRHRVQKAFNELRELEENSAGESALNAAKRNFAEIKEALWQRADLVLVVQGRKQLEDYLYTTGVIGGKALKLGNMLVLSLLSEKEMKRSRFLIVPRQAMPQNVKQALQANLRLVQKA